MIPRRPARTIHFANAWHPASGGIRTFYTALLERAEAAGRRMAIVVPGERDEVLERGAHTHLYSLASPAVPVLDRRYRIVLPHRFLPGRQGRVWQILDRERPDLIEVADKYTLCYLAGTIKRQRGPRPTVVGLSHERLDDTLRAQIGPGRAVRAFARWYMPAIYLRQFDAHIANSEYTADELRAAAVSRGPRATRLWRLRDRIYALPPGADVDGFHPGCRSEAVRADMLARTGGSAESVLIVFAGRLSAEKHVDDLVPVLHFLVRNGVDARLILAGDGPARRSVERDAAAFTPGRCVIVGHIDRREHLAQLVASADLFLHPNPREPFGIGPLEAMACGVPVVLPRRGGVLSYATDETSWLAGPGALGLTQAVRACLARPDEMRRRARNGVARARQFGWAQAAGRYFEAYDAIDRVRRSEWSPGDVRHDDAVDHLVGVSHREG